MLGVLVVLAGVALAVIGLVGAGVIHSPSQAATLLLALVALHVLLGGRVLRALLVAAGVVGLVHVYGLRVVDPLLRLIAVLCGFWVMLRGLGGRKLGRGSRT